MSKKTVVNTVSGVASSQVTEAQYNRDIKNAEQLLGSFPKVKFSIPKQLSQYLGSELIVTIEGVSIHIPVNGKEYEIPEPFEPVAKYTLSHLNVTDLPY